eukprot:10575444-Lingulodinium_polyedra.AAC.1
MPPQGHLRPLETGRSARDQGGREKGRGPATRALHAGALSQRCSQPNASASAHAVSGAAQRPRPQSQEASH